MRALAPGVRFSEVGIERDKFHSRFRNSPPILGIGTTLDFLVYTLAAVIKIALMIFVLLTAVAYIVWLERKVVGRIQNRWGPTRVGPFGLLQPAADGLKFIMKEDLTPPHVYKPVFIAAPIIAVVFALTSIAVIPFGNSLRLFGYDIPLQITDVNTGLLVVLGITSMGVYGIALAGWSSNNKYSMLGALARQRPNDQLRDFTGFVADWRFDSRWHLQLARNCGVATGPLLALHSQLEYFSRRPIHCLFHLPDFRIRRNQPDPLRLARSRNRTRRRITTPNTAP